MRFNDNKIDAGTTVINDCAASPSDRKAFGAYSLTSRAIP